MKKENKKGYDISRISEIIRENAQPVFHAPRGNSKLGTIPAWNVAPVVTCAGCAKKTCAVDGCYAVKNMFAHGYNYNTNNVLKAWTDNTKLAFTDLDKLEKQLNIYFDFMEMSITSAKFFRIHSAGDFFSVKYAEMWKRIAEKHTGIKFLAFTKQFDIIRKVDFSALENFSLVLSGWTGIEIPADLLEKYHAAFCVEKGNTAPVDALECPGNCDTCGMCWNLNKINSNVYFHKH